MRRLLTVHGVGTAGGMGSWQKDVLYVIGPHFECREIKYPHYRWLGLVVAVIEPWVLLPGLLLALTLRLLGSVKPLWPFVVTVVILALVSPFLRRTFALRSIFKQFEVEPSRPTPCVIAHSMGTYLVGTLLKKHEAACIDQMILAGCVLPVDYPWKANHQRKPPAFKGIRNDAGKKDPIPWLALQAARCRILPGFGISGLRGFNVVDGIVHTMEKAGTACQDCEKEGRVAPVHNVFGPFGHSGALNREQAAFYWMPWLWSIESDKYSCWLQLCLTANEHFQELAEATARGGGTAGLALAG